MILGVTAAGNPFLSKVLEFLLFLLPPVLRGTVVYLEFWLSLSKRLHTQIGGGYEN